MNHRWIIKIYLQINCIIAQNTVQTQRQGNSWFGLVQAIAISAPLNALFNPVLFICCTQVTPQKILVSLADRWTNWSHELVSCLTLAVEMHSCYCNAACRFMYHPPINIGTQARNRYFQNMPAFLMRTQSFSLYCWHCWQFFFFSSTSISKFHLKLIHLP